VLSFDKVVNVLKGYMTSRTEYRGKREPHCPSDVLIRVINVSKEILDYGLFKLEVLPSLKNALMQEIDLRAFLGRCVRGHV
jgi:hypothetical protein